MTEIQNAKGIMDVLAEMLSALEPGNKEGIRQEVIVDLVEQCRTYKQRVVHLVNSTSDESLLCQGLSLNDDLQHVLAKYESIASVTSPQNNTEKPNPASSGALVDVDGPLIDTGDTSKQTDERQLFLLFMSFSLAVEALHAFIQDESEHKETDGILLQMAPPSIPPTAFNKCLRQVISFSWAKCAFPPFYGKAGVNFYTQIKTITQQWKDSASQNKINMAMPTSQKS